MAPQQLPTVAHQRSLFLVQHRRAGLHLWPHILASLLFFNFGLYCPSLGHCLFHSSMLYSSGIYSRIYIPWWHLLDHHFPVCPLLNPFFRVKQGGWKQAHHLLIFWFSPALGMSPVLYWRMPSTSKKSFWYLMAWSWKQGKPTLSTTKVSFGELHLTFGSLHQQTPVPRIENMDFFLTLGMYISIGFLPYRWEYFTNTYKITRHLDLLLPWSQKRLMGPTWCIWCLSSPIPFLVFHHPGPMPYC